MMREATVDEMFLALQDPAPRALFAGAACSRILPTDIPDALTWRCILARTVAEASGNVINQDEANRLGRSPGVGLEAILGALEKEIPGLGTELVTLIDGGAGLTTRPTNVLHHIVGELLASDRTLALITTNFDTCFERAVTEKHGRTSLWIVGQPPIPAANVVKVHGCLSMPHSLRHTFDRIGRGFAPLDRAFIHDYTRRELFVIGYFGADPDVLEVASDGDTVWWLCLPREASLPRHGAKRLARSRDVRIVEGSFDDLIRAAGRLPSPMGIGSWLEPSTLAKLRSHDQERLLSALSDVSFRCSISDPKWRRTDRRCVATLATSSSRQSHVARGQRARFRGGLYKNPSLAARHYAAAAALCGDPERAMHESDAADAIEMIGFGLLAPLRARMWKKHLGAMRRTPHGNARAHIAFRAGRSILHAGRPQLAQRLLTSAFRNRDGDMFLGGIALRWRALARSCIGDSGWQSDIRHAEELFRFEDREQELADLQRTEAVCLLLRREDPARARRLSIGSLTSYLRRREFRGFVRSGLVLMSSYLGPFGRALLRFVVP